jgi:hypothetical protein
MADELDVALLDKVDLTRRAALRKLVLGAAYTVPVVASFAMSGLQTASALESNCFVGNTLVPCGPVPTLSEPVLPLFGAALGAAAVALMTRKTTES